MLGPLVMLGTGIALSFANSAIVAVVALGLYIALIVVATVRIWLIGRRAGRDGSGCCARTGDPAGATDAHRAGRAAAHDSAADVLPALIEDVQRTLRVDAVHFNWLICTCSKCADADGELWCAEGTVAAAILTDRHPVLIIGMAWADKPAALRWLVGHEQAHCRRSVRLLTTIGTELLTKPWFPVGLLVPHGLVWWVAPLGWSLALMLLWAVEVICDVSGALKSPDGAQPVFNLMRAVDSQYSLMEQAKSSIPPMHPPKIVRSWLIALVLPFLRRRPTPQGVASQ